MAELIITPDGVIFNGIGPLPIYKNVSGQLIDMMEEYKMAKKGEALESMIKRGGGVTKHQAIASTDMNKKKGRKGKKDRKP